MNAVRYWKVVVLEATVIAIVALLSQVGYALPQLDSSAFPFRGEGTSLPLGPSPWHQTTIDATVTSDGSAVTYVAPPGTNIWRRSAQSIVMKWNAN